MKKIVKLHGADSPPNPIPPPSPPTVRETESRKALAKKQRAEVTLPENPRNVKI